MVFYGKKENARTEALETGHRPLLPKAFRNAAQADYSGKSHFIFLHTAPFDPEYNPPGLTYRFPMGGRAAELPLLGCCGGDFGAPACVPIAPAERYAVCFGRSFA